jgi:ATP-binding cassette, subfamily F, member 3
MLTVSRVSKHYADEEILREISFSLNPGERVGLVGVNGSGKTTLLKIILGQESADEGSVSVAPEVRVGYLAQGLNAAPEATVQDLLDEAVGDLAGAEAEVERLAAALAEAPGAAQIERAYEAALTHLQWVSQQADEGAGLATLKNLGLADVPHTWPVARLSGGQKTRLALALVLLARPQLLLLDEPTNHLDLDMLLWLENWLAVFRGAALIVSHDRAFLDGAVTTILDLDAETHRLTAYPGNYSDYVEAKLNEREQQWGAWRDQESEIRRMKQDITRTKNQSLKVELSTTPRQPGVRRIAKKVARKALAREKKLDRYLESDDRVDKPKQGWQVKLEFDAASASGRDVLMLENLTIGYNQPLLEGLNLVLRFGERVALIGANGSGKTTLVRTAMGQLPPLAGRARLGASVVPGYFAQEQELLRPELNALTTLQQVSTQSDTELRNFLHYFLFSGDDVFTPVAKLSYGERARLALAALVARGCNFLVLDEPINHLDIPSRARFEQALTAFEGTSLVIAHDRYFIERFATHIWKVEDGTVHDYVDLEAALRGPSPAGAAPEPWRLEADV